MKKYKYSDILEINGQQLNKKYIDALSGDERRALIDPIFELIREIGMLYPDDADKVLHSYNNLIKHKPDLSKEDIFNNSSLATNVCQYFCKDFFKATERGKKTLFENFADDAILRRLIHNRLGLDWLEREKPGPGGINEVFNLSFKMIFFQGQRSMRLVNGTSMFKPIVAKYMVEKYSEPNDLVGDFSCGFGARLLGAMTCNRRYVGSDPMTIGDLERMAEFFKFDKSKYTLINSGSEDWRGEENSIDFTYSSPPYFDQEYYSDDTKQAYNNGEDYFYNTYLRKTLQNQKFMLKPGKVFGFNMLAKYTKILDMVKEEFGEPFEIIKLRTVKNHLSGKTKENKDSISKYEPIYMFRNNK